MSKRVVITGMGAVTPLGTGVEKFWEGIKANKLICSIPQMWALKLQVLCVILTSPHIMT